MMMGVSDNMACNQLIEEIGIERLNDVLHDLGYEATRIRRRMMDHQMLTRGIDNSVTAADIADMLAQLHVHRLVSNEASQRVLGYLRMNQLKDLIAWPLPGSAALAGKTGGMPGSLLDAELVSVPDGPTLRRDLSVQCRPGASWYRYPSEYMKLSRMVVRRTASEGASPN
jgi:beta-lactamase class A